LLSDIDDADGLMTESADGLDEEEDEDFMNNMITMLEGTDENAHSDI
jgi:hypothetical protein